jgi:hypothetical protein
MYLCARKIVVACERPCIFCAWEIVVACERSCICVLEESLLLVSGHVFVC